MTKQTKMGKPLQLTSRELDELAKITDEDIERVQARWRKTAPRFARNLLLANQPEVLKS